MKKALVLVSIVMFIFAPMTFADMTTEQGDMYVSLSGAWQNISFEGEDEDIDIDGETFSPDDTDILTINAGIEYFLSEALSLGVAGTGLWSDVVDLYGIGATCRLNFPGGSNIVPYIGAQYSLLNADLEGSDDGDAELYGPLAGMRIFMTDTANFFIEYQYQMFGGDVEDSLDDSHAIMFGIAYKWEKR